MILVKLVHLNSHHIFSRAKKSVRWSLDNGICLCAGCHTFSSTFSAHKAPMEFHAWLVDYMGEEKLEEVKQRSNQFFRLTEEVYLNLKEELK